MNCCVCGESFPITRFKLGYKTCLTCGDKEAKLRKHTIVPVPKSNYVYAHDPRDVLSPYSHKGNR